jgi:glucose-1-phosphate cytidylyltransferase
MQVVILAGGKGTRLSEYTKSIPKPMVKIGKYTILEHIINYYRQFGMDNFIIAAGYKSKIIKDFFKKKKLNYKVKVIDTGLNTLTGLRIKKIEKYITGKQFLLTYGDGLSNININKLIKFHNKSKKLMTLCAVHPPARFGELNIRKAIVTQFDEKPQLQRGWINGGFFVVQKNFFKFLNNKNVMLEREPINKIVKKKQLSAYLHKGFWYCMDTLRDKIVLEKIYKSKKVPWQSR